MKVCREKDCFLQMDTHQHTDTATIQGFKDEAVVSVVGHRGDLLWFFNEKNLKVLIIRHCELVFECDGVQWTVKSMAMNPQTIDFDYLSPL